MCKMARLTPEQYRVLLKRITKALDKAKYYPASVGGVEGPAKAAEAVLLPYAPLPEDS
jgi:hypothetical protein